MHKQPSADRPPPIVRFSRFVEIEQNMGCWLWQGATSPNGYGKFGTGGGSQIVCAHRWAYEHFAGPIPDGLDIDHLCRVRNCVNPNHLEAVTRKENLDRSPITINSIHARKTHCPTCGGDYTVVKIGRRCMSCKRAYNKRYSALAKLAS